MDDVIYVYYKVPVDDHAALAPRVREFQARLAAAWPGLMVGLLQRPEAPNGVETWMETYRSDAGLSPTLVDTIAAEAAAAGLPAPRHTERFIPLR